ncbi:MAG: Zn-ribbon domain-containing OB-fold protein [Chloroflexi bacterium]|nr:Zn-ribbon domain-containing OB-fold protein [Chloroflexota bacterium]
MSELLTTSHTMSLSWRYGTSWYFAEFIRTLRDEGQIRGLRCPDCGRVYLPPRPVCGNCHVEMTEWVAVKDSGKVVAFTAVHIPILDPTSGQPRPTPYGMALIQLDGADTTINHFLAENDLEKLHLGMRVTAVWREERAGTLADIIHFSVIGGQ